MAEERINVYDPQLRKSYSIPVSKLEAAKARGLRVEGEAEYRDRYLKAKYDDRPVEAFGAGVLRTVTGGLSDVVGDDPERGREVQAQNPVSSTMGEVTGAVLPIGAPAALARAGGAVSRAVAGPGAGVVQRVVAKGAGAATEGVLFGGGQTVSEVALSKDPMNAEAILARLGHNALLGGGVGFGVGSGVGLLGEGVRYARLKAAQLAAKVEAPVETSAAAASGDDLRALLAQREAAVVAPEVKAAARAEANGIRERLKAEDAAAAGARGADVPPWNEFLKQRMGAAMKEHGGDHGAAMKALGKEFADLKAGAGVDVEMVTAVGQYRSGLKAFDRTMRRARARARKVEGGAIEEYPLGPGGARPQKATTPMRKVGTQPVDEADVVAVQGDPKAIKAAADRYDAARVQWEQLFKPDRKTVGVKKGRPEHEYAIQLSDDELRKVAQDPLAIRAHQEMAAAYTNLLGALNPAKQFENRYAGIGVDLGVKAAQADDLARAAAGLDDPTRQNLVKRAEDLERLASAPLSDRVAGAKSFVADAERLGLTVTPEDLAKALGGMKIPGADAEWLAKARVLDLKLRESVKASSQAAKAAASPAAGHGAGGGLVGGVVGGVIADALFDGVMGVALGGILGAGVGRVVRRVARRPFAVHVMGARGDIEQRIAQGVKKFLGTGKTTAVRGGAPSPPKLMPVTASLIAVANAFGSKAKTPTEATKDLAIRVRDMAANERGTSEVLWARLEGIRALNLDLYDQISTLVRKGIAFLAERAPQPPPPRVGRKSLTQDWLVSSVEAHQFARTVAAVEDPLRVVDELGDGSLSAETVEAVQTLRPALFARIKIELMTRIAEMPEDLPFRQRVDLGLLLGVPLDESMEPLRAASLQEMHAVAAEEQAQADDISKDAIGSVKLKQEPQPTPAQNLAG